MTVKIILKYQFITNIRDDIYRIGVAQVQRMSTNTIINTVIHSYFPSYLR